MEDTLKWQETATSLFEIGTKPLINYTIEALQEMDSIDEIFVVTNGLYYPKFQEWKKKYPFSKIKVINDNTTSPQAKLGAIGDIRYTINSQNIEEDIMVLAGDVYFDFSLADFVAYYQKQNISTIAGMLAHDEDLSKYGVIEEENGMVAGMQEKPLDPKGNIISLAAYIFPKDVLRDFEDYLSEGNKTTYPGYFVEYLYKNKPVSVYQITGNYYDMKSLQSLEKVKQKLGTQV